jgi:hypothetical protein
MTQDANSLTITIEAQLLCYNCAKGILIFEECNMMQIISYTINIGSNASRLIITTPT